MSRTFIVCSFVCWEEAVAVVIQYFFCLSTLTARQQQQQQQQQQKQTQGSFTNRNSFAILFGILVQRTIFHFNATARGNELLCQR